jgi:hypothetical protein
MFPTDVVEKLLEDLEAHLKELETRAQLDVAQLANAEPSSDS